MIKRRAAFGVHSLVASCLCCQIACGSSEPLPAPHGTGSFDGGTGGSIGGDGSIGDGDLPDVLEVSTDLPASDGPGVGEPYYPPLTGDDWETIPPSVLGWNEMLLQEAFDYAAQHNSTALIVLFRGRIVREQYWQGWDLHSSDGVASVGKSIMSVLVGLCVQDGLVSVDDRVNDHVVAGWSNAAGFEDVITIRHLLTMTSGLDDQLGYVGPPDTVWHYNTEAYQVLRSVVESATGTDIDTFSQTRLWDRIGMLDSRWGPRSVIASARDMARFGLMILSQGTWDRQEIIEDKAYLSDSVQPSQSFNPAYGYLWWLNGKGSWVLPDDSQGTGPLIPNAPQDLMAALGLGDKKIYVVSSEDLVVVRHGDSTGVPQLALSSFDNLLWQKLVAAMP